jgi:hypothetical protein
VQPFSTRPVAWKDDQNLRIDWFPATPLREQSGLPASESSAEARKTFHTIMTMKNASLLERSTSRFRPLTALGKQRFPLVCAMILAAGVHGSFAADEEGFAAVRGQYRGSATVFSASISGAGSGTASVTSKDNGKQGGLRYQATLSASGSFILISRNLKFARRSFRSSTTLNSGGSIATGVGAGRYTFRRSTIRFVDNSIFTSNGSQIPVAIQGSATFSKKRATITETWLISGSSSATFRWSLRKRG